MKQNNMMIKQERELKFWLEVINFLHLKQTKKTNE